jgi:formate-dependent nitrite reductase membrane component NrfD
MTELDIFRNSHLVDPSLHIWGWEIPVYLFLGGLTAGLMILAPLLAWRLGDERSNWSRWLPFAAPLILSVGMFALLLDLEYKTHVFRFYTSFQWTSPMSWGSWILVLIYPAVSLLGLAYLTPREVERHAGFLGWASLNNVVGRFRDFAIRHLRALEWSNLILGVALGAYTGILLGTLGARALWSSGLLGPLFLVSGLSTGAALFMLFPINKDEHHLVRNLDIAAIGLELVLLGLFFVDLMNGSGQVGRQAASLFLGGSYTAVFWSLVVIAGLMVPLFLEVYESRHKMRATLVAPVLLLIGGFALRWILVTAGQVGL